MQTRKWEISIILILLLLPLAGSAMAKAPAPGCFVTKATDTPEELSVLVQQDSRVAARYSSHFGMSPASLATYFHQHLTLTTLTRPGDYETYFIGRNGHIFKHMVHLAAGTKVFAAEDGKPVIIARCGNPMAKTLPKIISKKPVFFESSSNATQATVIPELETPLPIISTEPLEVLPPTEPEWKVASAIQSPVSPVLTVLPILAGLSVVSSGSHSHGNVVPEPSGLFLLAAGGFPAMLYGFRRNRKS